MQMAEPLADELKPNASLRRFTNNPVLIGAYAEHSVREFIAKAVFPLRVSTGSIIHEENTPTGLKQLDSIVWQPSPVPAMFERGNFAIVPRHSAVGYLEIKSSDYAEAADALVEQLNHAESLIPYSDKNNKCPKALAVVCIQRKQSLPSKLVTLEEEGKLAVIFKTEGDQTKTHAKGMFRLIQYLTYLRGIARQVDGAITVAIQK